MRSRAGLSLLSLLTTLVQLVTSFASVPHVLKLERRAFPPNDDSSDGYGMVDLSQLKARDIARHGRRLASGVVDFPVYGKADPIGLYFTRIQLGTPPREFNVQIDSGSDALWVACSGCIGCPLETKLKIPLSFYDPAKSSTGASVSCEDEKCRKAEEYSDTSCLTDSNRCGYRFQFGDGSTSSGYYMRDKLNFMTIDNSSVISNASASIVFGCSIAQSGQPPVMAVDGIFGFGQKDMSVISQLASQGVTPRAFSHCLKGSDHGGGILVLGEVVKPDMVYSPLISGALHYSLNLQSISVNQQILPIDPSLFAASDGSYGSIIDSGTTLVYVPEVAYNTFVDAISKAVVQYADPVMTSDGAYVCYAITGRVDKIFPSVSLNFAGNSSMLLRPEGYLLLRNQIGDSQQWCIGFQKSNVPGMTIIGDLALKDKIVVYDLDRQRIGWSDYDCSSPVNVSTTSAGRNQFVTAGQISKGLTLHVSPYWLIASSILISFIQTLFSSCLLFY